MSHLYPELQQARPGGNNPMSAAVWTPENNGDRGLEMALENQRVWGGHVFASETRPGYAVWFDASYTPSEVMMHQFTQGHSGVLNPSSEEVLQ